MKLNQPQLKSKGTRPVSSMLLLIMMLILFWSALPGTTDAADGTLAPPALTAGYITTIAGNGTMGYSGDGGPVANALLNSTYDVAFDSIGNLFIADYGNNRVRMVAATTGVQYGIPMTAGNIYTVAGNGTEGYSGDGSPATSAQLNQTRGIAVDSAGNLYIADGSNFCVRKVDLSGVITTVAGTGLRGYTGDGGPATDAQLTSVYDVTVDGAGNLYIADYNSSCIRMVAAATGGQYGISTTAGNIYTVAGTGTYGYTGDGGPATSAQICRPRGVEVDSAGSFYIADSSGYCVRKVDSSGVITTVAGTGIAGYSGDGGPATEAQLGSPNGVAVDGAGSLYIADGAKKSGTYIRKVNPSGVITTLAGTGPRGYSGDGGPATSAQLNNPWGLALDSAGNLYIADSDNYCVRYVKLAEDTTLTPPVLTADTNGNTPGQAVELTFTDDAAWRGAITGVTVNGASAAGQYTVAEGSLTIDAGVFTAAGDYVVVIAATGYPDAAVTQTILATVWPPVLADGYITTIAGNGTSGYSGDGGPAADAQLNDTYGVTLDSAGNLYISDTINFCVRMIPAVSGAYYGIPMTAGNIYTVAGTGAEGYSDDGGPAVSSMLKSPYGLAVDSAGNLYINDQTSARIRKVDPSGILTTVAGMGGSGYAGDGWPALEAKFKKARGLAVDSAGNIYIADSGNHRVRVVAAATGTYYGISMTAGNIYTVAGNGANGYNGDGGAAVEARVGGPQDVVIDSLGNLYISSSFYSIRKVNPSGIISTAAGTGTSGYTGDGGLAVDAQLISPNDLALDSAGNLYIVSDNRIRRVAPDGIITTIAGGRGDAINSSGDGGPAITATLDPQAMAVDSAGDLYIAAGFGHGVRYIKSPASISALTSLQLSGSPDLTCSGVPLTYDLNSLVLTGKDQSGADFDLSSGHRVTWEVASGPATVSDSTLNIVRGGTVVVTAQVFGVICSCAINVQTGDAPVPNLNTGDINTVAGIGIEGYDGDGGPADNAQLRWTYDVAFDSAGNLFIADYGNCRVRMVAATTGAWYGIPVTAGNIYTVAGDGSWGNSGDGGLATSAQLNQPRGVAVDSSGNLYIADYANYCVRKVDLGGIITTVAGTGTNGYTGDGGPATGAKLTVPNSIALDGTGSLFIADKDNNCIRMVAATTGVQYGIDMYAGNIYTVAGNGTSGYTGDGGPATSAWITRPDSVAVDSAGNLYIADGSNHCVRKVDPSGVITTVAGNGTSGCSGDGGPATGAQLALPDGVAAGGDGSLYISDGASLYTYIRKVDPSGIITTLAGTGSRGYSGDGGPAASAQLNTPMGLALDSAGNLYIADSKNHCVRYIKLAEDTTLTPPALTADSTGNIPGQAVELTFTDDAAWRDAITGVTVNGAPVAPVAPVAGQYTVAEGSLTIDGGVFTTAGDYNIVVTATGYTSATVTQAITRQSYAVYTLTTTADTAYQSGINDDGIHIMTVNDSVSGMKYFGVQITPVQAHEELEAVVFTHQRNGVQLSLNVTKADFDQVNAAQAGFNVQSGDIVKVYIVDDLTNDVNSNPIILQ